MPVFCDLAGQASRSNTSEHLEQARRELWSNPQTLQAAGISHATQGTNTERFHNNTIPQLKWLVHEWFQESIDGYLGFFGTRNNAKKNDIFRRISFRSWKVQNSKTYSTTWILEWLKLINVKAKREIVGWTGKFCPNTSIIYIFVHTTVHHSISPSLTLFNEVR